MQPPIRFAAAGDILITRRLPASFMGALRQALSPADVRVANLETRIGDLEEEMTKLEIEMSDPDTYADTARAQNLSRRYDELQKKIAALHEE